MLMTQLDLTVVILSQGIALMLQLACMLSAHPAPHALVLPQGSQEGWGKAAGGKFGFLAAHKALESLNIGRSNLRAPHGDQMGNIFSLPLGGLGIAGFFSLPPFPCCRWLGCFGWNSLMHNQTKAELFETSLSPPRRVTGGDETLPFPLHFCLCSWPQADRVPLF